MRADCHAFSCVLTDKLVFFSDCAAAPLSGKAHCKSHPLPVDKEPPVKRKSAEDNPTMKSAKLAAASRALAALRTDDEDE